MQTDFEHYHPNEMDRIAEQVGCLFWGFVMAIVATVIILVVIHLSSCAAPRYIDDFQGADTIYLYDTNQLFIIDNGKVVQVHHYPIKMW